jgi:hypothetical protein
VRRCAIWQAKQLNSLRQNRKSSDYAVPRAPFALGLQPRADTYLRYSMSVLLCIESAGQYLPSGACVDDTQIVY